MRRVLPVIVGILLISSTAFAQSKVVGSGPIVKADGSSDANIITSLSKDIDEVTVFPGHTSSQATTQVSCGTTTASLSAANTQRMRIDLSLLAAGTVSICRAATCTTATAYTTLSTVGGDPVKEEMWQGALSCITASGTATVAVSELTLPP